MTPVPTSDTPPAAAPAAGALPPCRIERKTLPGGRSAGMEAIEVDNGRLRLLVLPQRGMGIWKAWLGGLEWGWNSPVGGPVHPSLVPIFDPSGLGWLEGFDELLCRCGLASNGAPDFDARGGLKYPLHGRIANLPADTVDVAVDPASGALRVTGVCHEVRFHYDKLRLRSTLTLRPGAAGFEIEDEVTNLSAQPTGVQLLYHYNLGAPLLGAGASVVAPVRKLVPRNARAVEGVRHWQRCDAPRAGSTEQVYFAQLHADADGQTLAMLKNAAGDLASSVRFDTRQLPCFVVWKNGADARDGYVTGIEPGTNFPNPRSFEAAKGRVVELAARATARYDLGFAFHQGRQEVEAVAARIARLQDGREPSIHATPDADWCC